MKTAFVVEVGICLCLNFGFVLTLVTCYFMQVRKRPLNKKETAKHEEDIIDTVSNSLTVHETKLKVSVVIDGGRDIEK